VAQVQANPYVKQAIQLEQWLMEGAYNKVLAAAQQLPSEFHSFYMQQLSATVRCGGHEEGAACARAFHSSVAAAVGWMPPPPRPRRRATHHCCRRAQG
jgi:26S proteasome regulatory subunit N12